MENDSCDGLKAVVCLLVVIMFSQITVHAQSGDVFLPLQLGNEWTYYSILYPPDAPPDTLWTEVVTVSDGLEVGDTTYVTFSPRYVVSDQFRHEDNRAFVRIEGREYVMFDFSLNDGETYAFGPHESAGVLWPFTVHVTRYASLEMEGGTYSDAVQFEFLNDAGILDTDFAFTFARGIGLVGARDGQGSHYFLRDAIVDNQFVTFLHDEPVLPDHFLVDLYPNPVMNQVMVSITSGKVAPFDISVFDLLGREVQQVGSGHAVGDEDIRWNVSGYAAGMYIAVITLDGQRYAKSFLVRR